MQASRAVCDTLAVWCGVLCCAVLQAREDGLEMVHWVKGYKDANGRIRDAQEGDYPFAKYNKKVTPQIAPELVRGISL
jgi:hypothetical protein